MGAVVSLDDHRPKPQPGGNNKGTRRRFGNVRKLPSKRWQASYLGPDEKRHNAPTTFQTKGDAETWLNMQDAAITEHRWKPEPPPQTRPKTFAAYSKTWLAGRELKPRTRAEYDRLITGHLTETFGDLELKHITRDTVNGWWAAQDPSKDTTRAHAYALLKTILASAIDDEYLTENPCRIRGGGTARSQTRIRPATLAELDTIADHMPEKYRLAVHLSAWCALRFGELTELRRKDVDVKHGVIRVRRAVTWVEKKPVVGTPKTAAGVRDVTIPPHLVPMIRDHIAAHAQAGRDGLLFPNTEGEHLHHGSLYKVYKPARKAAGREDLRWHDLRHTGATMAAQAGATTRELMDRLGHTTAGVAMRYQHVADGRAAELARKLSDMATPAPTPDEGGSDDDR